MLHKKIFLHYITKLKKMEYTSLIEGVSVMDSVPNHNNTLNPWTLMDIVAYFGNARTCGPLRNLSQNSRCRGKWLEICIPN
jgi:hypothetical protein